LQPQIYNKQQPGDFDDSGGEWDMRAAILMIAALITSAI
jgi:hypothetical protein